MTESTQSAIKRGHPGAGKKRTRKTPKGRLVREHTDHLAEHVKEFVNWEN